MKTTYALRLSQFVDVHVELSVDHSQLLPVPQSSSLVYDVHRSATVSTLLLHPVKITYEQKYTVASYEHISPRGVGMTLGSEV